MIDASTHRNIHAAKPAYLLQNSFPAGLAALLILLVAGCSPMTHREKWLLGGMVAAQAADAYTTNRGIDMGGNELNPILGDQPDSGNVWLFKGGVIAVIYALGEIWPEHREGLYTVGLVVGGGCAASNLYHIERND